MQFNRKIIKNIECVKIYTNGGLCNYTCAAFLVLSISEMHEIHFNYLFLMH